jgi:hypothetical protein
MNFRLIIDLNVKDKIIKLKDKIRGYIHHLEIGKYFSKKFQKD